MKKFSGVNEVIELSSNSDFPTVIIDAAVELFWSNFELLQSEFHNTWKEKYGFKGQNDFTNKNEVSTELREVFAGIRVTDPERLKEINFILTYGKGPKAIYYPSDVRNHSKIK